MQTQPDLFSQSPSAPPRAVSSVTQQTGWRRPAPTAICQDHQVLLAITEFDFDLTDPGFQAYARSRGVLHGCGIPGSHRWRFTADHAATRDDFMADPCFRSPDPGPITSAVYLYPPEEMETHWRIMRLAKAKLQDCWELYRTHTVSRETKTARAGQ